MKFEIPTTKEVADKIFAQSKMDKLIAKEITYEIGKITHRKEYSIVEVCAKNGIGFNPQDLFWLGYRCFNK